MLKKKCPRKRRIRGLKVTQGTYDPRQREIVIYADPRFVSNESLVAANSKFNNTFKHESDHAIRYATGQTTISRSFRYDGGILTGSLAMGLASGTAVFLAAGKNVGSAITGAIVSLGILELGSRVPNSLIAHKLNPEEKAVREIVDEMSQDPRWENIVTLSPKTFSEKKLGTINLQPQNSQSSPARKSLS